MSGKERLRLKLVFFLAGFSFIPFTTNAQRGAGMRSAPAIRTAAVAHAPMGTARSRVSGMSVSRPVRSNVSLAGSPFGFFGNGNFGPGLAFAPQSSFAGANDDFLLKAAIDPATQWRIATAERLFRLNPPLVSGIAYFWPPYGYGYGYPVPPEESNAQPALEQAPVSGQQQPIIIVQGSGQGNSARTEQQAPVTAPEAPLPDVGQFTLVLRNGKKIDAIAFTKLNGKIIYVTPDGSRRTLSTGDLDPDATNQVNEERGTPLQL
jgi:hypothetical protein